MAAVYTNTPTLKTYLAKDGRNIDDALLDVLLGSAESAVNRYTGRSFGVDVTESRSFSTRGCRRVRIPDVRNVTSVKLAGVNLLPGYYAIEGGLNDEPANVIHLFQAPTLNFTIGVNGINDLVIAGHYGWTPVPDDILDATYVLAARYFRERGHEYADAVQTEIGVVTYINKLPGRAKMALNNVRPINFALV